MLYIWMPEANGVWQWSEGEFWQQASSLEQLIQDIRDYHGKDATVFFPSRDIQLIQQQFSKAQYKKLGTDGVKYLLEEYVILPLDYMKVFHHFENPEQLFVMGIAQSTAETIQHALTLIPVKVQALLPDFLVLPEPEPNQLVIANIAGHLLVRENKYAGQSIDDLSLYLDYQTLAEDKKVKVSHLNNAQLQSLNAVVTQDRIESFQYVIPTLKKSQTHPWNILPKAKNVSGVSGYWKACAAVLCAFIFVQIGYDAIRWYQNKKVADLTAVQAVDQFKSWFGQSYPVTEQTLKSQFEAQLRLNQTGNTQALQLLSRVGPLLMQHQVVANRVSYEASVLNMELKASSAQVLQQLTEQLNQQGFKVELGNIQPKDNGAVGQVKIQ